MKRILLIGLLFIPNSLNAKIVDADYNLIKDTINLIPETFNYGKESEGMFYTETSRNNLLNIINSLNFELTCDDELPLDNKLSCSNIQYYLSIVADNLKSTIDNLELLPADKTNLNNAIMRALMLDRSKYTVESLNAIDLLVFTIESSYTLDKQEEVDELARRINEAVDNAVPLPADYSKLLQLIEKINFLDKSLYTKESLKELDNSINIVSYDKSILEQSQVDEYYTNIESALSNLTLITNKLEIIKSIKTDELLVRNYNIEKININPNTIDSIYAYTKMYIIYLLGLIICIIFKEKKVRN